MNGDDILNPKELIVNAIQGKKKVHIENDVIKRHFKTLKNGGKMAEDFSKILDAINTNPQLYMIKEKNDRLYIYINKKIKSVIEADEILSTFE